jgi:heptose I phosphotransferase
MKDFSSAVNRINTNHLIINKDYQKFLQHIQFDSFESIWGCRNGESIKNIEARSVIRLTVKHQNQKKAIYLKRHNLEFVGFSRLFSRFFPKWGLSQGRLEFENICVFRNNSLPTVIPIATGEKFFRFFWAESFLITEDFSPYISLEELLEYRPHFFTGPAGETKKKILINEMAVLARRMHQNGFNHRDFNATHIILNYDNESDVPKIALFDLQRIDRNRFFKFRWKIKSLARLNYTLPDDIFSEKDKLCIFLSYKGKKRLDPGDRLEWFWIKRKTAKIKRHHEKTLAKR